MPDKEDILLEQYKIINDDAQAAHKHAWQMTSIFVPVIGGGIALACREPLPGTWHQVLFLAMLVVIIWFWKSVLIFLDYRNDIRFRILRALEKKLTEVPGVEFHYHGKYTRQPFYRNFSCLTMLLAIVLSTPLLFMMIVRMVEVAPQGTMRTEDILDLVFLSILLLLGCISLLLGSRLVFAQRDRARLKTRLQKLESANRSEAPAPAD